MGAETLILASLVATAASAGMSAYGSYQQGKQLNAQAKHNANIDQMNQQATSEQADYEMQRTRDKYRRLKGSQIAAASASGRDAGSMSDIFKDTVIQEDMDILSSMYKAKNQIIGLEAQRQNTLAEGRQAKQAGTFGAVGSLLGGAGKMMSGYASTLPTYRNHPTIQS